MRPIICNICKKQVNENDLIAVFTILRVRFSLNSQETNKVVPEVLDLCSEHAEMIDNLIKNEAQKF